MQESGKSTNSSNDGAKDWGAKVRRLAKQGSATFSQFGSIGKLVFVAAAVLFSAGVILWLIDKIILFYVAKSYVDQIADAFDLNKHLTRALIVASFATTIFFTGFLWSLSKRRRVVGFAGVSLLLIGHSFALWYATRNSFFDRSGHAVKCYVLSRDGKVTYGERPGVDPTSGRLCRPVTAEMLERLQQYEQGKRPQLITDLDPTFFDPRTGEPIVWFYRSQSRIQIFDLMGFHPDTGEELTPISKEIVAQWKVQAAEIKKRIPKSVDPETFVFFDPRNGSARAWFWRGSDGKYEFFDSPGFHPRSGEALALVTRDILDEWKKSTERAATPQRVDPNSFPFFDPATGVAKVWYWRGEDGSYEFYDSPGFHPRTGDKLQIVTREIAAKWKQEIERHKRTDITKPQRATADISLEARARSFLSSYMSASSSEPSQAIAFAERVFASDVTYFGKKISRLQLLEDKKRYLLRWPERSYQLKPETIRADCNAVESYCDVGGVFYFRAYNPVTFKLSSGVAMNQLRVVFSGSETEVVSEDGRVLSREAETQAPVSDQQPQQSNMSPEQQQQIMNGFFGVMRQLVR